MAVGRAALAKLYPGWRTNQILTRYDRVVAAGPDPCHGGHGMSMNVPNGGHGDCGSGPGNVMALEARAFHSPVSVVNFTDGLLAFLLGADAALAADLMTRSFL